MDDDRKYRQRGYYESGRDNQGHRPEEKPRSGPSMNGSAAVPPCPTTPLRVPIRPENNADRLGRQGTSEA